MIMMGSSNLHTSNTVSLLGGASTHHRPCVDGFILHVRNLSTQCLCYMSLCTRAHPKNCLLACLCAKTLSTCPSEEEEEAATKRREKRMVVSTILFVVLAKKFALIVVVDTWCVQMTSATKLVVTTFLE